MKCVGEGRALDVGEVGRVARVNIKAAVSDVIGHKCVDAQPGCIAALEESISQNRAVFNALFNATDSKVKIGKLGQHNIGKMSEVGEPQFMSEIPHSDFHRIVELLFDGDTVSADESLSRCDVLVGLEERIANTNELEFMTQSFLQVEFKSHGQSARGEE